MSCNTNLACNDAARRDLIVNTPATNGIAAVEVVPLVFGDALYERLLDVTFYRAFPAAFLTTLKLYQFTGGSRIAGSKIVSQQASGSGNVLRLQLNQTGDFSDYTLTIDDPSLDPLFNCYTFNFQVDCPRLADCKATPAPNPALPQDPQIDYLTKDYNSFRQALLSFLPTRVPGFQESSEADLAVTLAELFAYAGDQLSYYQDAVANESALTTARQRISAKRHGMLVDYHMHDGVAALVALHFNVAIDTVIPYDPDNGVVVGVSTNESDASRRLIFETVEPAACRPEWNSIDPWAWMGTDCCLPLGATQVDLAGDVTNLTGGQLLLVEETLGPVPQSDGALLWAPEAADPSHRQIVRIASVELLQDPLAPNGPQPVTRVKWNQVDALTWAACIVAGGQTVTVFRGNMVRATHGQTVFNEPLNRSTSTLSKAPVTWLFNAGQSAPPFGWLYPPDAIDLRGTVSSVRLTVNGQRWNEEESLLNSQSNDPDFVVDCRDDGAAVLRFGDGQLGRALPPDAAVLATYRAGNGAAGNVGRDCLTRPVGALPGGALSVRNPLPACGGADPEPIEDVRRNAPEAFSAVQYRAVTAADYAKAAELVPGVENAAARFGWTGSWLTVYVAIDPVGRFAVPPGLVRTVFQQLDGYRQAGYDLDIRPPEYVPIQVDLTVCIENGFFQADVIGAVKQVLGVAQRPDGLPALFSPSSFTFGQSVYLSRIYAAVQDVSGVKAVHANTFRPLLFAAAGELQQGVIPIGPFQIARLDNDPSRPENGVLTLTPEGGL